MSKFRIQGKSIASLGFTRFEEQVVTWVMMRATELRSALSWQVKLLSSKQMQTYDLQLLPSHQEKNCTFRVDLGDEVDTKVLLPDIIMLDRPEGNFSRSTPIHKLSSCYFVLCIGACFHVLNYNKTVKVDLQVVKGSQVLPQIHLGELD